MDAEQKVGAGQLSARLRGVSPPVTRRLRVAEQTSLAELHAALQVAFGWSDGHLYVGLPLIYVPKGERSIAGARPRGEPARERTEGADASAR